MTTKTDSLSVLIKKLDLIFGDYIKTRDSENGYIKCFVCGCIIRRNEAEILHFIPRAHMRTRFLESNCKAGCIACNKFDPDHIDRYEKRLLEVYGFDFVQGLKALHHSLMKFTRSDILELIEEYKEKLKRLS